MIFLNSADRSILKNIAMILQYLSAAPRANFPAKVFPEFNFELRRGEKSTSFNTYVHKHSPSHVRRNSHTAEDRISGNIRAEEKRPTLETEREKNENKLGRSDDTRARLYAKFFANFPRRLIKFSLCKE